MSSSVYNLRSIVSQGFLPSIYLAQKTLYDKYHQQPGMNLLERSLPPRKFYSQDALFDYTQQRKNNIIVVFRHGDVDLKEEQATCFNVFYPGTVSLHETGREKIKRLGKTFNDRRINRLSSSLYLSPFTRTKESAEIFTVASGISFSRTEELAQLQEIDIGYLLQSSLNIFKDPFHATMTAGILSYLFWLWINDPEAPIFPGGESMQEVWKRVGEAQNILLDAATNGIVYVSGHELVNRLLVATLLGLPLKQCRRAPILGKAGVIAIDVKEKAILYAHRMKYI